jgi:hypothetical protein
MKIEFVEHNGVRMPKGWAEEIEKAQDVTKIKIAGRLRDRVRYGSGESRSCHDCLVSAGQLHVMGCDDEKCPACGMQLITCGCCGGRGNPPSSAANGTPSDDDLSSEG